VRPPSVDALARSIADVSLPHPLLVEAAREAIAAGDQDSARQRAQAIAAALLQPVINATGVLLHTNLGRAPLGVRHDARYSNLELDLGTGRRGSRHAHVARLMAAASGAEAALVVNNGASAVFLALAALAGGQKVLVSRGELVEIGGGFRIPDVLAASGADLVEVGTTNRTRRADYESPAGSDIALVLKVHQSNFRVQGFTESVDVRVLAEIGPPVVYDIGSGLLDAATPWLEGGPPSWLSDEPAARQALADGAALVTFSTDKLFGGPQGGVIAGSADLVGRCARHPLYRALRPGQLVLSALQDVLLSYLRRDGAAIPLWAMASASAEELESRAEALGIGAVVQCESAAGGGSLPGLTIPSAGVAIEGDHAAALRAAPTPVVARVHDNRTVLDLRTVDPGDDVAVKAALLGLAPEVAR
jgi:L-seryl-tRNA(Ser) seleniumtransferase